MAGFLRWSTGGPPQSATSLSLLLSKEDATGIGRLPDFRTSAEPIDVKERPNLPNIWGKIRRAKGLNRLMLRPWWDSCTPESSRSRVKNRLEDHPDGDPRR
jgi:hypothetical protein